MCTLITIMIIIIKYLGCVVDEFLDCSSMVEHRVKLGSRALGAWLGAWLRQRCETVVEVNGRSFVLLMQSLWWSLFYCTEQSLGLPPQVAGVKSDPVTSTEYLLWCGSTSSKGVFVDGS